MLERLKTPVEPATTQLTQNQTKQIELVKEKEYNQKLGAGPQTPGTNRVTLLIRSGNRDYF